LRNLGATALQAARKPDSVLDDHSSRRRVTAALQQPTRKFRLRSSPGEPSEPRSLRLSASGRYARAHWRVRARSLPIWSCSVWGLPCGIAYALPGALLPHLFTLTAPLRDAAVYFLLHWPSSRLEATVPDAIRHTALRSPDFPPPPDGDPREAAIIQPPAPPV